MIKKFFKIKNALKNLHIHFFPEKQMDPWRSTGTKQVSSYHM